MTTDRTPDSDKQAFPPLPRSPHSFIAKLFGDLRERAWVTEVGDVSDGSEWLGARWEKGRPLDVDKGHYFACSTIRGGSRALRNFEAAVVFVLDDMGAVGPPGTSSISGAKTDIATLAFAPDWTYRVKSSADNYQIGYKLKPVHDLAKWQRFLDRMKQHPLFGRSVKEGDAVHYFRIPSGRNTKPGRGNCDVILVDADWTVEWDLDDLARAFHIDMTAPVSAPSPGTSSGEKVSIATLKAILKALPNDRWFDGRDRWITVVHAAHGATNGDEEAKEEIIRWSSDHPSFDEAETIRVWDTLVPGNVKASASTLRRIVEERLGRDSETLRKIGAMIAFDEENAPPLAEETKKAAPDPGAAAPQNDVLGSTPWVPSVAKIPPREWLYAKAYIRKFVSGLVAPGGTGKTSLSFVEAVAMASGQDLLDVKPRLPLRVSIWNGEDPVDELNRRLEAICLHYNITAADLGDRLRIKSGRDVKSESDRLIVAKLVNNAITVQRPVMKKVVEELRRDRVDVLTIDPFISSHQVPENSNDAIEAVVKEWARVAELANCSVLLVHHLRKMDVAAAEVTADDARGASAYRDALRVLRLVASMDRATAAKHGLNPRAHFRLVDGKANMAPSAAGDDWYRFVSVSLRNGVPFPLDGGDPIPDDEVGVVTRWTMPTGVNQVMDADVAAVQRTVSKGSFRRDLQSPVWVGRVVATSLGLDIGVDGAGGLLKQGDLTPKQATDRKKARAIVADWIEKGHLKIVLRNDETRREREFVEVGEIVSENVTDGIENPFEDEVAPPY